MISGRPSKQASASMKSRPLSARTVCRLASDHSNSITNCIHKLWIQSRSPSLARSSTRRNPSSLIKAKHGTAHGREVYATANGKVSFTPLSPTRAALQIETGSSRGSCELPDQDPDGELAEQRPDGSWLWVDADVGCSVSLRRSGDVMQVSTEACYATMCGVHAPSLDDEYRREK